MCVGVKHHTIIGRQLIGTQPARELAANQITVTKGAGVSRPLAPLPNVKGRTPGGTIRRRTEHHLHQLIRKNSGQGAKQEEVTDLRPKLKEGLDQFYTPSSVCLSSSAGDTHTSSSGSSCHTRCLQHKREGRDPCDATRGSFHDTFMSDCVCDAN